MSVGRYMKDNAGYGRLITLPKVQGCRRELTGALALAQGAWMVWGGVRLCRVGGCLLAQGRLQLTFPSPEYMMELYGLVQVQDQAQVCPGLDLSDWTSLGYTWCIPGAYLPGFWPLVHLDPAQPVSEGQQASEWNHFSC